MKTDISIIVPVYNVESYIEQCLQSISTQKKYNIEVIVVNDGSTDRSGDICNRIAANDSRFHVIHQDNGGSASARNKGMQVAKGDWLLFVDGDDEMEYSFIEQIDLKKFQNYDIVFFHYSIKDENDRIKRVPSDNFSGSLSEEAYKEMMFGILNSDKKREYGIYPQGIEAGSPWAKLYRRNFIEKNKILFPNLQTGQDVCFNFIVQMAKPNLYVENIYSYAYRIRQGSSIHSYAKNVNKYFLIYHFLERSVETVEDQNLKQALIPLLNLYLVRVLIVSCSLHFCHSQNHKSYQQRKEDFLKSRNQPEMEKAFKKARLHDLRLSIRIGAVLCKYKLFGLYDFLWKAAEKTGVKI